MKVYVAGSSQEMERAKWAMNAIRAAGHEVAYDWVANIERVGCASLDGAERRVSAREAFYGVLRADVFWLLAPAPSDSPEWAKPQSTGAWVELGVALCLRLDGESTDLHRVVISGNARRCIFAALAEERDTDEEALASILGRMP